MPAPMPSAYGAYGDEMRPCIALTVFDVSVPLYPSRLEQIAVFYSMLPWIGAAFWTLTACTLRRTSLLVPLLWVLLLIVVSEGFKKIFPMPRPQGSCLHSKGMPSSHSAISIGMLLWCLLTLRTRRAGSPVPLRHVFGFTALCIMLVPVPFSRVYLYDHTPMQVIVGSILGATCAAFVAFSCERRSDTLAALLRSWQIIHDDAYAGSAREEAVFFDLRPKAAAESPPERETPLTNIDSIN